MLGKNRKKEIQLNLNELFADLEGLMEFCDKMSNDLDKVYEGISKGIKYVIVNSNSMTYKNSLREIVKHLAEADRLYREYINRKNKNTIFSFFHKKGKMNHIVEIPLDEEIEISDLQGVILPTKEFLERICKQNIENNRAREAKYHQREAYYRKQKGFEEVGMVYTRTELLQIDRDFMYYYSGMSGEVEEDFRNLYNGERYQGRLASVNPLYNSYIENVEQIRRQNDISLTKIGNVYFVENGRHRILYIMRNGEGATIPVTITKRIENQEFNRILEELKRKYNMVAYKNNTLNDNPDILLRVGEEAYRLANDGELVEFYHNLQAGKSNNHFEKISFVSEIDFDKVAVTRKYEALIYQKYLELGKDFITGNFTDVIKHFERNKCTIIL